MKKVFVVAGELSGDQNAAWFVNKRQKEQAGDYWEGVGGDFLAATGTVIFERFEKLNVTGVVEIITHLPRILRIMRKLVNHIIEHQFTEVVLVDFPGFNLKLAGILKKRVPHIKITYVAPPQLWCWGAWRVKKIKNLCDAVIVLYPFEVAWYKQHGVIAQWLGCPVYDALEQYIKTVDKRPIVALMPGSRHGEVERFLPLLTDIAQRLHQKYPQLSFVIPLAQSLPQHFIEQQIQKNGLLPEKFPLSFVRQGHEKNELLSECCLAITKPGTVTLELALFGVPSIVFFKISKLTFFVGRRLVKVAYMALPNLLLKKTVYPECIQHRCTPEEIVRQADKVLASYFGDQLFYHEQITTLEPLRQMLHATINLDKSAEE